MKDDFKGFYSHYQSYKKWCKAVLTLTIFFFLCQSIWTVTLVIKYSPCFIITQPCISSLPEGDNAILWFCHDFFLILVPKDGMSWFISPFLFFFALWTNDMFISCIFASIFMNYIGRLVFSFFMFI